MDIKKAYRRLALKVHNPYMLMHIPCDADLLFSTLQ